MSTYTVYRTELTAHCIPLYYSCYIMNMKHTFNKKKRKPYYRSSWYRIYLLFVHRRPPNFPAVPFSNVLYR